MSLETVSLETVKTSRRYFAMVTTSGSAAYTPHALSSFFSNTPFNVDDRFFLIDNNGDCDESMAQPYPRCELVRNDVPRGFAENANWAMGAALEAGADLYFLNNDIILTPKWLTPFLTDAPTILTPLSNREVQYAASVQVIKTQHISELFCCEMIMRLEDYLGHEASLEAIAATHRKTSQGLLPVLALPFFCVKIPVEVMRAVGQFDTTFGQGGGEDYDYCLRAHLQGFSVHYALASFVLHFGGKSSWSGVETPDQQRAREAHFRGVFRQKWGDRLHDLILKEDASVIAGDEALSALHRRGDLRELVKALIPNGS